MDYKKKKDYPTVYFLIRKNDSLVTTQVISHDFFFFFKGLHIISLIVWVRPV